MHRVVAFGNRIESSTVHRGRPSFLLLWHLRLQGGTTIVLIVGNYYSEPRVEMQEGNEVRERKRGLSANEFASPLE